MKNILNKLKRSKRKIVFISDLEKMTMNITMTDRAWLAGIVDEKAGFKTKLIKEWYDYEKMGHCFEVEKYK